MDSWLLSCQAYSIVLSAGMHFLYLFSILGFCLEGEKRQRQLAFRRRKRARGITQSHCPPSQLQETRNEDPDSKLFHQYVFVASMHLKFTNI